jgi:hypothetical protein
MMVPLTQISVGVSVWTATGSFYWGWAAYSATIFVEVMIAHALAKVAEQKR